MTPEPDPETLVDIRTIAAAAAPRFAEPSTVNSAIVASSEQSQYDDAKKKQILGFRRWLVPGLFTLTCIWLVFVATVLVREEHRQQKLSDAVLIALLGTATANVLGLLVIVLKSLFPVEFEHAGE